MKLVCPIRTPDVQTSSKFVVSTPSRTLLQTAKATADGPHSSTVVRCILDGGSESSFISHDLAKKLKLKVIARPHLVVETFGGGVHSQPSPTNVYRVKLRSIQNPDVSFEMNMVGTDTISKRLHTSLTDVEIRSYTHLLHLPLSDVYMEEGPEHIQILIGADYYFDVVDGALIKGEPNEPTGISTAFGWVLSGPVSSVLPSSFCSTSVNCVQVQTSSSPDEMLNQFFSFESYGMEAPDSKAVNKSSTLEFFEETIRHTGERYEVSLPWKEKHDVLLSNEKQARQRFCSLARRLERDPELRDSYGNALGDFFTFNFLENVPLSNPTCIRPTQSYYLPHHPVVKKTSKTYKVRPVFDASCRGPNGVSLNDCLEVGPSLNPEIPDLLLRFRMAPIVVTSDIRKAFLQMQLNPADRDVCRILWKDDQGVLTSFRFRVVAFGIVSAPFLLRATISYHLKLQPPDPMIEEMDKHFYVDNLFQNSFETSEACEKAVAAREVMKAAGMELCQWTTNSDVVETFLQNKGYDVDSDEEVKFLGMRWHRKDDQMFVKSLSPAGGAAPPTKRIILSTLAKIYDPLGYHSATVVRGKLLLQKIWLEHESWDEPISNPDLLREFQRFMDEASTLSSYRLVRCPFLGPSSDRSVHVFCDASEVCAVTCIYLREESSQLIVSNFLIAKSKVIPLKFPEARKEDLRIPRKELVACLMGAKLGRRIVSTLGLSPTNIQFWTDSEISLWWIKHPRDKAPVFVKNRVSKIREISKPETWFHVRSGDNPADLPSRGNLRIESVASSDLWKHGPPWLVLNPSSWPEQRVECPSILASLSLVEETDDPNDPLTESLLSLERYSSLAKAIRVAEFVLRFIDIKCPRFVDRLRQRWNATNRNLDVQDLDRALMFVVRQEQNKFLHKEFEALKSLQPLPKTSSLWPLRPTWDAVNRIMVSVGRERPLNPLILLPKESHLSYLVLFDVHEKTFHGGSELTLAKSRERFWIICGRVVCKKVIRNCTICRVFSATPFLQKEAALPDVRVGQAPAFQVCGCDYAGPFHLKEDTKCYILLFTCGVVRALHLELVKNLSTASFLDAFRRFQARRCSPKIMISDNGLTFRHAAKCLSSSIKWRFIAEKSPWWGGFYERLVKSVKNALRRTLGRSLASFRQLETLVIEIESVLNSRPLTIVGDDPAGGLPLTPNHFLRTEVDPLLIPVETSNPEPFLKLWRHRQRVLQHFWSRWRGEYLTSIRNWRQNKSVGSTLPKVGDLVLIELDRKHRIHWPMGRIQSVINGVDGFPRAAYVRVVNFARGQRGVENREPNVTILRRSTRLLYPLETCPPGFNVSDPDPPLPKLPNPVPAQSPNPPLPPSSSSAVGSTLSQGPVPETKPVAQQNRQNAVQTSAVQQSTRTGRQIQKPSHLKDYVVK